MKPATLRTVLQSAACIAALLASSCGTATEPQPPTQHRTVPGLKVEPDLTQDQRMAWWRNARFGMFLHWGLYAIPAGAWNGKTHHGEWIRDTAQIPLATYDGLQAQWDPSAFDADAWARMAKAAGMQYVVITSKHHDGFCLYDSAFTDWDVGKAKNPRDILGELATACRKQGITFCTYHSIMDWHHPDYLPRRPWETTRSTDGADFKRFESYLHAQVTEIVERYRPGVMWFDGEWENTWTHERGLKLWSLCRALDPKLIVNNRVDVHRGGMAGFSNAQGAVGDFATPEQEIPATGLPGVDWESCMTMNDHWGWNAASKQWKSTQDLVRNLIDIASKGGNYLLNVGPRADGTFPPEAVQRLAEIGKWMDVNGEAIHGTTASVFDKTPWGRCTVRAGDKTSTLYLHVFATEAGNVQLPLTGLANKIVSEPRVLGGRGTIASYNFAKPPVPPYVLVLQDPDPIATVVAIEIEGRPDVVTAPKVTSDSEQFVQHVDVTITQPSPSVVTTYTIDGTTPTATSPRAAGPIRIDATCVLRAASFRGEAIATDIVSLPLTKVTPLPAAKVLAQEPGLRVERFAGQWSEIPDDLEGRGPDATHTTASIALPKDVGENVLLAFRGVLDVPADDVYRFALTSDDGSRLWIDGQPVINHDGLHGASEKQGHIALGKGPHTLRIVWFNKTGGAALQLQWAAPGQPFAEIPAERLRH